MDFDDFDKHFPTPPLAVSQDASRLTERLAPTLDCCDGDAGAVGQSRL